MLSLKKKVKSKKKERLVITLLRSKKNGKSKSRKTIFQILVVSVKSNADDSHN